jgi:uncharacterized protein (TIGR02996 family)
MGTEEAFLQAVLADPSDNSVHLVYSDWLEERGDPMSAAKAEFLRLTVQLAVPGRRQRLQQLAAGLETGWLSVVSRLAIENCEGKRAEEAESRPMYPLRFDYLCEKRWENLRPTDDRAVRFCDTCLQNVHYCDTITDARRHAWAGHCIAIDRGVIRRDDDLVMKRMYVGTPSVAALRAEQERMKPDAVSAERERRKQAERAQSTRTRTEA